ncbi:Ig-like domain-containing protein [Sanguibacter sp. 25GB23B1]|uniref:Ig-like domain-containing protein n=1 Tax=unclassified Sanguibacter TaxID=2645534 RepID=UPI0032AF65E3
MRTTTIVTRVSLAAILGLAPIVALAGPASAAVAVDDAYLVDEDAPLTGDVLSNDVNEGFPVTAALLAPPSDGTLTLSPDGTFTYQPDANFNGTDTFTYQALDGLLPVTAATVTITVAPVVDPVVGDADSYSTPGGTQLTVGAPGLLANDVSPDGRPLTVGTSTAAADGTVAVSPDGSFTYVPDAGFRGVDTFTYVVDDVLTTSAPVAVTITVANAAPVATPETYVLDEDTTLTATTVLANDSDPNGDPLSAVLVAGPSNGVLDLRTDGTFDYTPAGNFNGVDTFTYQASDGTDLSAVTTVTLTVGPVADAPFFAAPVVAATLVEDTQLVGQATATSPDGLALTYGISATGAAVIDPATGAYAFTPAADFVGLASVEITACDSSGRCAQQVVNVTVSAVADAPVAADASYTLFPGAVVGSTLYVVDADNAVLTFRVVVAPQRGVVTIDASTRRFLYTPSPGPRDDDSFVYEVCDPGGLCDTATVSISPYRGGIPLRLSILHLACIASAPDAAAEEACRVALQCLTFQQTPAENMACYQAAFDALAGRGAQTGAGAQAGSGVAAAGSVGDELALTGGDVGSLALGAVAFVGLGGLLVTHGCRPRGRQPM